MLVELSNPSILYPFYEVPSNISDTDLANLRSIKKLQIAIGLFRNIQNISINYNVKNKSFIVTGDSDSDTSLEIFDFSNSIKNDTFYFDPYNSDIQYSQKEKTTSASKQNTETTVIKVLPQVLLIYPVKLEVSVFYKEPVTIASQNSNSFLLLDSPVSSLYSGYNCDVTYTNGKIFLNSYTDAGKGIVKDLSIYQDYSGSSDSCQIQNQEGFYTINGQFGDITLSFGNSISVLYTSDSDTTINKKLTIKLGKAEVSNAQK